MKKSSGSTSAGPRAGEVILDEPAPGIARLTLSNPGRRGALDVPMLDSLAESIRGLDARCLIITGEGPNFSAGYDIGDLVDDGGKADEDQADGDEAYEDEADEREPDDVVAEVEERVAESAPVYAEAAEVIAPPFGEAMAALEQYPYPSIAAINGHAIGGGLELAIACDIRIAAREARLGMPAGKLGLIYSHTGIRRFIEVCGVASTNELFLVGRNVGGDRAAAMGIVNQVEDRGAVWSAALVLAREVVTNSPLALRGNKAVLRKLRNANSRLPAELEEELLELRESSFHSPDFKEGVRAFSEKRPPRWNAR